MSEDSVTSLVILNDAADGERVRRWFQGEGFKAGPLVGISFSIEGPRAHMEKLFSDFTEAEHASESRELALNALSDDVRSAVKAVALETPPDFGPWNP